MDIIKISESKKFRIIIGVSGGLVVALLIFQAGVFVGFHKASFSSALGDNYYRAFAPREKGMMGMGQGFQDGVPGGHGATGRIVNINLPSLIIEGGDNIEKEIIVTDDTLVRRSKESISPKDLKVGDFVVVIGSPDDTAQVEAKLIRLLPPPINATSTATSTVK